MSMKNMQSKMNYIKNNAMSKSELMKNFGFYDGQLLVCKDNCEYCNRVIYAIWDEHNYDNYWPYPGTSAVRSNTFKYSRIVMRMRELDRKLGTKWIESIMNTNAKIHCDPPNESIRFSDKSIKILCNECFRETYSRMLVKDHEGNLYAVSVVESRNEKLEDILENFGIDRYKVLGKGSINDYR